MASFKFLSLSFSLSVSVATNKIGNVLGPRSRLSMTTVIEPTRRFLQVFCGKTGVVLKDASPFRTALAPVSFWLFPNLQHNWKGARFQDVEEFKKSVTVTLKVDSQDKFHCFASWCTSIAAEVNVNLYIAS
jgi:hypothetical protein